MTIGVERFESAFVELFGVELDFVGDDDQLRILAGERREPELALAARYHEANVAVFKAVGAAGVAYGVDYLPLRPRHVEHYGLCGAEEAVYVLVELEDVAVI